MKFVVYRDKYERKEPAEKLATNQAHVFFLICSQ